MKRNLIVLGVILVLVGGVSAQAFRNIAGFSVDSYFDGGGYISRIENVFIAPLVEDRLQLQAKVMNQVDNQKFDGVDVEPRSLTMFHLGPIVLFSPHLYGLYTYGVGFRGESETIVHAGDAQLHYETAEFRVGGGVRGQLEPQNDVAYLVGSLGGRVQLPRGIGVFASYYVGFNNDSELSHALWSESDYAVTPRITVKLGGSIELGDDVAWPDGSDTTYSVISGAGFSFSEEVSARYQLDYIGRADRPDGIRNLVFVDWRF